MRQTNQSFRRTMRVGTRTTGIYKPPVDYVQTAKAKKGYKKCPRCEKHYADPEKSHYADFKNKIRCF